MQKNSSVYAFIDSQNLNLGIKSQGWMLDFGKFRQYLRTKYKVKKTYLFIGYIPGNQKLYTYLQSVGYICIFKPTLEIKNKNKIVVKGNVDADLVLHAMIEFNHYEKAIIVSGDGDFFCLIDYWYQKGKLLHIITPSQKYSSLLKKYAKHIIKIGLLKEKLRRK
ncbi:hypothetical protein COX08_03420 [Candidatus Beckwithbacteria bacterium CG23_combo_of_CG06-09_8_20_14_all_34_8]|uniref:NYN domain-containing protein n=1 Tax=Candidatus Beckwithbacteria bacterium CG23_combo_of_CG06-09_8_20_14_all_34_8 TaxID=1974497 RepID=A0A2H0B5S7_9BACT|nr:MAG: hypothetical protein COX08_03420 [Candidatus Beckwithbacteria bacterium CG23_combo_of_CG06-09_8_20_14_all_34_8]